MSQVHREIFIDAAGRVRFIYSDDLAPLLNSGDATVHRASHVEPIAGGRWQADMRPVNGPVLRATTLRSQSIDAELQYLSALLATNTLQFSK